MILQPNDTFTVVRQIANHLDTGTYYVRAVIRNARTDTIIENLDLTDKGGQRFKKDWNVPSDPTGNGFYISIVTSVYTDSGYTTKSGDYGDEENTYLIDQRRKSSGGGGGGISARDVRDVVSEEISKIKFPEQKDIVFPKQKEYEMRWDEILTALNEVKKEIKNIPKTDLTNVLGSIERAIQAIENKEVTPETDLTPILEALADHKDDREMNKNEMKDNMSLDKDELLEKIPQIVDKSLSKLNLIASFIARPTVSETLDKETVRKTVEPEEDEQEDIDITKLAQ